MSNKKYFYFEGDRFRRTSKEISPRVAFHNRDRCEWIGKGKDFSEISNPNSVYMKNIPEGKTLQDGLRYDIEDMRWIEKF